MNGLKTPESEFTELADRSTDGFARAFKPLLIAAARKDDIARMHAIEKVARVIAETMALADLYGRRRVFLELDYHTRGASFAVSPVVPKVPYREAIEDLITREPRLAQSATAIADLYNTRHAFAMARSADQVLTSAVQGFIGKALEDGMPAPNAQSLIEELSGFTRGYATTVYRTNLTTAYTAGRFQQAKSPEVRAVLPAMERWEVGDSATRRGRKEDGGENHLAVNGLIMRSDDARWSKYAPPAGHGCRGWVSLVSRAELRRKKLLTEAGDVIPYFPPGIEQYRPHALFGKRRPDLVIYGGG